MGDEVQAKDFEIRRTLVRSSLQRALRQESGIGAYPTGRGWTAVAMDRGKGFNPARHNMTAKASRV
jgi:hypothetical protein